MGAGQALPGFDFRPVVVLQVVLQILRQLCNGCEGIVYRGHGFIVQGKFLGEAGKLAVVLGSCLSQTVIKSCPVRDQQGTYLTEPGVVLRQNIQKSGIFKMVL